MTMSVVLTAWLICAVHVYAHEQPVVDDGCEMWGGKVWNDCGSPCTKTCDDRTPMCIEVCEPKCECPADKPLWYNDLCVTAEECPECSGGQVWAECQGCPQTCEYPDIMCMMMCVEGCTCPADKPIWHHNQCITRKECPDPCEALECADDEICVLTEVQCITAPCPPVATCVSPCKDAKCDAGEVCVLTEVQCVTTPCPPEATCVAICSLPPDSGPCDGDTTRWYWDGAKCQTFTYGGCEGNANNFEMKRDCNRACKRQGKGK